MLKPDWMPNILTKPDFLLKPGEKRSLGRWVFDDPCEECLTKRNREDEAKEDARKRLEVRRSLVELLGGEVVADRFTFDTYKPETDSQRFAFREARNFSPSNDNMYLWGKHSGTGKSHLAGAIVRASLYAGLKVEFWKASRVARAFRKLDHMDYEKLLKRLVMADLFVLDDLGVGTATDFSLSVLYDIADERVIKGRKGLLVTSNLSLGGVTEKFNDDRLSSRLAGLCRGHIIEVEGPDGRLEGGSK